MSLVTSFFRDVLWFYIELYLKTFKYAGVLFLVLLVECICLWIYCDDTLGRVEVAFEELQVADISYEEEISSSGEDGYRFYLTIKNKGSKRELAGSSFLYDDKGSHISCDESGVYQNIADWGSLYNGVIVPPGSQTKADFFVSKLTLRNEDTENLIFKAGWEGKEASLPLSELNLESEKIIHR